jgi:uncharacterized protein
MAFASPKDAQAIKDNDWDNIQSVNLVGKMRDLNLLVPGEYDEGQELQTICQTLETPPEIRVMYMMLTEHCNFDCTYCFIRKPLPADYKPTFMSSQTAKLAIDRYADCLERCRSDKEKVIIFYGGEPLLNLTALKTALKYIKLLQEKGRLPKSLKLCLNTNGSLVTRGIAGYLQKHGVNVAVSLDGREESHDVHRVYHDRRGTFQETMRGFHYLKEAGIPLTISCTTGPHNIKAMKEITRWFVEELGIRAFGWNILSNPPGMRIANRSYTQKITAAALKCYDYCLEHQIYEDSIGRIASAFFKNRVRPGNCAACGEQMVVSPRGKIGICYAFLGTGTYFDHSVEQPFHPEDDPAYAEWKQRSPLNIEECLDCPALGICGGGCPYEGSRENKNIWDLDRNHCTHARAVLEWLIWKIYRLSRKGHRMGT